MKNNLLNKENFRLKERLSHTKPVIDNKIINNEFQKLKKVANCLRKVRQKDCVGNIYLNRKESQIIRKYELEKIDFYQKNKEKENKKFEDYVIGSREFATSIDNTKNNTNVTNKKFKTSFNIDKKILKKVAYV